MFSIYLGTRQHKISRKVLSILLNICQQQWELANSDRKETMDAVEGEEEKHTVIFF